MVSTADANGLDGVDDGLKSGSAHTVHGFARHLVRQPGFQPGLTSHVHARACLQHATHDHVANV
jgi:hypothetical protein